MRRLVTMMGLALAGAPLASGAAPEPAPLAACGESRFEVIAPAGGGNGELRALVVGPDGNRWRFTARVGLARAGGKTRTVAVEDLRNQEGRPARGGKDVAPSQLFIDLFLDDKKVTMRHASEGDDDPAYALDLGACSFPSEGDVVLAGFAPKPPEAPGCDPDTVRAAYLPRIKKAVVAITDEDAARDALALCEDHQKTIAARNRLEQSISDRAARQRIGARGAAILRTEETRRKTWSLVDGCLKKAGAAGLGIAGLREGEARTRTCYERIAAQR